MYMYSTRFTHVRPELEYMGAYLPGESLESFSTRTGIPVDHLIKLNSNESPFGPVPSVMRALGDYRSEEHTSELQSHSDLVCRLLLEKKKTRNYVPSAT